MVAQSYELAPIQHGMLFHAIGDPGSGVDIEQIVCNLNERVDVAAMLRAWDLIVSRHSILRTSFAWEGIPEPVQEVHDSVRIPCDILDWRGTHENGLKTRWEEVLAADRKAGFDLSQAPLIRLRLVQLGESVYRLLWTFHHVLLDGRSFPIVLREVFQAYAAFRDGQGEPVLPIRKPYRDYIEWLRMQDQAEAEQFFRHELKNFRGPTPVPASSTPGSVGRWGVAERRLSVETTERLRAFSKANDVTLNTLLQGAWALVLHRYSGEEDVVFGTTQAGRASTLREGDAPVGLFINTLPMRCFVRPDAPVGEWLREIRETHLRMRPYQHASLRMIQRLSEVTSGARLFDSILVFENYFLNAALRAQGGEWLNRQFEYIGQTNFPITMCVYADAETLLRLEHDPARLNAAGAERLLGHLVTVLDGMSEDARRPLSRVPMLTEPEVRACLAPPRDAKQAEDCIHQRFERQARRTPDAIAISCDGVSLTYAELNRRANAVAKRLVALGAGPEVLVALYVERDLGMVVGILGILKAGAAYLPIDLSYPRERMAFMLDDAEVKTIVSQRSLHAALPEEASVLFLDDVTEEGDETFTSTVKPENLAYVIYTSGSTGKPKGCQITHANVARLFDQTDRWFGFNASDVWTLFHSCAFDFSVWEIWGALLYGGRLLVVPYLVSRSPEAFAQLIRSERVTVLNQTPSAFRQLAPIIVDSTTPAEQTLRYVIFGGEALDFGVLLPWLERFGDNSPALINMYGITETTVHVTYRKITLQEVREGSGSLIGEPIPDLAVYLLDAQGNPVPVEVPGEMYVAGGGVARGYLRRPELTAQRFIENPFTGEGRLYRTGDLARRLPNGDIEYLGRVDHQVKIRGFRIELGEIESVVSSYPGIREAVVIAREDKPGEKKLVAYFCATGEIALDTLRAHMKVRLPDYMVPAAFVPMDFLPLTSNGKVDRRALPAPDLTSIARTTAYVAPRTAVEKALASIWSEVLGVGSPGIHDNFFELGGDSILTIQVITRARKAGIALSPRDLFKAPTICELAATEPASVATPAPDIEEVSSGEVPLTPIQRWFFEQPFTDRNHWNQTFLFEVPEEIELDRLEKAFSAAMAHHDAFRLRFEKTSSDWRQFYVDKIPALSITCTEYPPVGEQILTQAMAAQRGLDISKGPLLAATHFPMGPGKAGRLLIAVHHLIMDGVSWRILLEDVESAYWALRDADQPALPPSTASYKSWSAALAAYAERPALQAEDDFWQRILDRPDAALPVDYPEGLNTEDSTETVTERQTPEQTEILLRRVPGAFHCQINDVLLTALAEGFRMWTGRPSLLVDVEGHGREDVGAIDVSRTIGWFTSIYPVLLSLGPQNRLDNSLQTVKGQLRQIPNKGLGYGLLKDRRGSSTHGQIAFNYLGQFDQVVAGSRLFRFADEPVGLWHGHGNRRTHLIEVIARVSEGVLTIDWNFSRNIHTRENVEQFAACYFKALTQIATLSTAPDAQRWSAVDFALTHLAEAQLKRVLERHPALEDIYPLSPMQQLFHSMEDSASQLGFEQWRFVARGALNTAAMRRAWESVIERHPILRTAFVSDVFTEPLQVVLPARRLDWTEIDLRNVSAPDAQRKIEQFLDEDRAKGFDLGSGQLIRLALLRTTDDEWQMVWSTHHLLIDGWSWPVVFDELAWFYAGGNALPKARPYRDYIAWLLARSDGEGETFWREYLKDCTPIPLRIGQRPSFGRRGGTDQIGEEIVRLDEDAARSLLNAARGQQITLNTLLQGAWALILSHYQGSSTVVFGAANSGRPAELPGIEGMIGPCVNNLPVRATIVSDMPASIWLKQMQEQQFAAAHHQYDSIDQIQRWSGIPWRFRLFDSLVVFQNYASGHSKRRLSETVSLELEDAPESTNYPLTLTVQPGDEISLKVLYSRDRFEAANIRRLLSDLGVVLRELGRAPGATLREVTSQLPPPPAVGDAAPRVAVGRSETTPHSEMERTIAAIWKELFDDPQINLDANFFELGGHSLLLVQAHHKLQEVLGRNLPIVTLLQHPSVRALAHALDGNGLPRLAAGDLRERARRQHEAAARMKAARKG